MSAIISECGKYRYLLTRGEGNLLGFVMLNPSTADASVDDPAIRRCMGFAKRDGYDGIAVANLYALRSTDPKGLWEGVEPVGDDNDAHLAAFARTYPNIVLAWGANGSRERVAEVVSILRRAGGKLWCLGRTLTGSPRHPLYMRADAPLRAWL